MSTGKVRAINCTSCGAPLTLHGGGHKIRTLNCEFCGAVLDARHDYKVLARFSEQTPPYASPLSMGMTGEINGIHFSVIGIIAWRAGGDDWVDYQLFSETHGYAWLSYEKGHWIFSRRTREMPNENFRFLGPKDRVTVGLRNFRFYEKYSAEITYVAGELTWVARVGDLTYIADSISPPNIYSAEGNKVEMEYYLGEYIEPEQIQAAFGTKVDKERWYVHPAQPYRSDVLTPLSKYSWPFLIICLIAVFFIRSYFHGEIVLQEKIDADSLLKGTVTQPFEISSANRLVSLELGTRLNNAWANIEATVYHNQTPIFSIGKELSYYSGRDSDGYWSEGSRNATAYFLVPEPGDYKLEVITSDGGTGEYGTQNPSTSLSITIREGYVSPYYFQVLLVICAIAVAFGPMLLWSFETRRWKPVMEEDD